MKKLILSSAAVLFVALSTIAQEQNPCTSKCEKKCTKKECSKGTCHGKKCDKKCGMEGCASGMTCDPKNKKCASECKGTDTPSTH